MKREPSGSVVTSAGVGTITAGGSEVEINHTLGGSPTAGLITPFESCPAPVEVLQSSIDASKFTDTMYGWNTGTGSVQAIAYNTHLIGVPYDVRRWYIGPGSSSFPSFFTNETSKTLNVTADSGRLYRYVVHTSA